jgi:hypothetical protein
MGSDYTSEEQKLIEKTVADLSPCPWAYRLSYGEMIRCSLARDHEGKCSVGDVEQDPKDRLLNFDAVMPLWKVSYG